MDDFQKFLDRTTRAGVHGAVIAKVHVLEQELEAELDRKRERLRILLETEERCYAREMWKQKQLLAEQETQETYRNYEKMERERKMEKEKFVEMKRKQQHLINCHELRSKLQQALLEESKSAQLKQIEEKKRLQQIEKDEEDMWLEVERRAYEAKLLRERTEQSIREERNASTTNYLNWQVANKDDGTASKLQAMEEEKRLNTLRMAEIKSSDAKKKAELEEKKREIAAFCKRQVETRQKAENERRAQDLDYDKMVLKFTRDELAAAKAKKLSEQERRRVEVEHFVNYFEQQRRDRQLTEKEQEELMNAFRKKVDAEAYEKRRKLRERQRLLNEEVFAYQCKQIEENRERSLQELHEKNQERLLAQQTHRQNMEMEAAKLRARRQQAVTIRKQLDEQLQNQAKQLLEDKKNDIESTQHTCEVDEDVIAFHPNYQVILSASKK